jgi:hypothetical protein
VSARFATPRRLTAEERRRVAINAHRYGRSVVARMLGLSSGDVVTSIIDGRSNAGTDAQASLHLSNLDEVDAA